MVIRLLAAGSKLPSWVNAGFEEYARRMPRECRLELVEIALARRTRSAPSSEAVRREGERMLSAVEAGSHLVALDSRGRAWNTEELSGQLDHWLQHHGSVTLLIGGPDGLAAECLARADQVWSLSPLTFPNSLVRVMVAEQLYRAWSYLKGHPYHRAH